MTQIGNPIEIWELPAPLDVPGPEEPAEIPDPVEEPEKVEA